MRKQVSPVYTYVREDLKQMCVCVCLCVYECVCRRVCVSECTGVYLFSLFSLFPGI